MLFLIHQRRKKIILKKKWNFFVFFIFFFFEILNGIEKLIESGYEQHQYLSGFVSLDSFFFLFTFYKS